MERAQHQALLGVVGGINEQINLGLQALIGVHDLGERARSLEFAAELAGSLATYQAFLAEVKVTGGELPVTAERADISVAEPDEAAIPRETPSAEVEAPRESTELLPPMPKDLPVVIAEKATAANELVMTPAQLKAVELLGEDTYKKLNDNDKRYVFKLVDNLGTPLSLIQIEDGENVSTKVRSSRFIKFKEKIAESEFARLLCMSGKTSAIRYWLDAEGFAALLPASEAIQQVDAAEISDLALNDEIGTLGQVEENRCKDISETTFVEDTLKDKVSQETDIRSGLFTEQWGVSFKEEYADDMPVLVMIDGVENFGFKAASAQILYKLAHMEPNIPYTINDIRDSLQNTEFAEMSDEAIRAALHIIENKLNFFGKAGYLEFKHTAINGVEPTYLLKDRLPVNRNTDFLVNGRR